MTTAMQPPIMESPPGVAEKHRKRKHSDENDLTDDERGSSPKSCTSSMEDDRRAHHNELERRRRDHIKDHFMCLKDSIPLLEGEKSSRALILKRAVEYISIMQSKLNEHKHNIEQLRRRNELLETQLKNKESHQNSSTIGHSCVFPSTSSTIPMLPVTNTISPLRNIPTVSTSSPFSTLGFQNLSLLPQSTSADLLTLTQALLSQTAASMQQQPTSVALDLQSQLLCSSLQQSLHRPVVSAVPF